MAETVITIKTTSEESTPNLVKIPIIGFNTQENKHRKKRVSRDHFYVNDEKLLYKIAEAGLLDKLHGINYIDQQKTWFFDKDDDVKAIIDKYYTENESDNNNEKVEGEN